MTRYRGRTPATSAGETAAYDEETVARAFPGEDPKSMQDREIMLDFIRSLRMQSNGQLGTRAIAAYLKGDDLKWLFLAWRRLVDERQIKASESISRALRAMIEDYCRLAIKVDTLRQELNKTLLSRADAEHRLRVAGLSSAPDATMGEVAGVD